MPAGKIFRVGAKTTKVPTNVKKFVKKSIKASEEMHQIDFSATDQAVTSAAPVAINVTAIAQGDDLPNRTGNQITVRRVQARAEFHINAYANKEPLTCRVLLVRAKMPDGVACTYQQITASDADSAFPLSVPYDNPSYRKKFDILYDKVHILGGITRDGSHMKALFKINKFLKQGKSSYSGAAVGNGTSNQIYLLLGTEHAADCRYSYRTRTYFTDNS